MGAGAQDVGGTAATRTAWAKLALAVSLAALLTGCWNGSGPSSSVNATANPTATGASSPGATTAPLGLAAPGQVTVDPSLPDALPLPAGIWSRTAPGWVLATYAPHVAWWSNDTQSLDVTVTKHVVYLVSPEGQRYQVLELDPYRVIQIESWRAGETTAIIREGSVTDGTAPLTIALLDLTSGDIAPYATPFSDGLVEMNFPGSARVWDTSEPGAYVERDGAFVPLTEGWHAIYNWPATRALDANWIVVAQTSPGESGESRTGLFSLATNGVKRLPELDALGSCYPLGPVAQGHFAVSCYSGTDATVRHFDVDAASGAVTADPAVEPPDDAVRVDHEIWISPGVWVGKFGVFEPEADMSNDVGVDDHGKLRRVVAFDARGDSCQTTYIASVVNGVLYLQGQLDGNDSFVASTVVAYDLATDTQVILLPAPLTGPGSGIDPGSWGVTSWVVAP